MTMGYYNVHASDANLAVGPIDSRLSDYVAAYGSAKYCTQRACICLCVCLSVRSPISKPHVETFLCPWLGPTLTTEQYVMYFVFCEGRHVCT